MVFTMMEFAAIDLVGNPREPGINCGRENSAHSQARDVNFNKRFEQYLSINRHADTVSAIAKTKWKWKPYSCKNRTLGKERRKENLFEPRAVDRVRIDELLHIGFAPGRQRRVTVVRNALELKERLKSLSPCGLVNRPPGFVPIFRHRKLIPTRIPLSSTSRRQFNTKPNSHYSRFFTAETEIPTITKAPTRKLSTIPTKNRLWRSTLWARSIPPRQGNKVRYACVPHMHKHNKRVESGKSRQLPLHESHWQQSPWASSTSAWKLSRRHCASPRATITQRHYEAFCGRMTASPRHRAALKLTIVRVLLYTWERGMRSFLHLLHVWVTLFKKWWCGCHI